MSMNILVRIPFEALRIEFEGGEFVSVERNEGGKKPVVRYCDDVGQSKVPYQPEVFNRHRLIEAVEEQFPEYKLLKWDGRLYWADPRQLEESYGHYFLLRECLNKKRLFDQFPDFDNQRCTV